MEADPSVASDLEEGEQRQEGMVRWAIYAAYLRAVGPLLVVAIALSLALMQVSLHVRRN